MPRTIRLLQIAKHFHPDVGGIETVTEGISDMLPGEGIRADVLCTGMGGGYPDLDRSYAVHRCAPGIRFGRNKSLSFDYLREIARMSSDYDCALVHLPNPVAAAGVLAAWRRPFILLWHADIPQRAIRTVAAPLDALLIRRAARVIGPTPVHLSGSHHASALAGKGVVIGYPFNRARLPAPTGQSAAARAMHAALRGRRLSLAVGRLVPYKGFDVLIEAARRLASDTVIAIVGGGPLDAELRARVGRLGLEDRVHLTGPVPDVALADLLDLASVVCMPSVTAAEMYGMTQVEAFAFGKPVISTDIPGSGVPYVNRNGETGLVVPPGDATALAEAHDRLAAAPALHARLSAGAARAFREQHDAVAISRRYAAVIREAVGG